MVRIELKRWRLFGPNLLLLLSRSCLDPSQCTTFK